MRRILLFVLKRIYDILSKEDFMPVIGAMRVMMHQMTGVVSGEVKR